VAGWLHSGHSGEVSSRCKSCLCKEVSGHQSGDGSCRYCLEDLVGDHWFQSGEAGSWCT
jgi:hypothetical protein